MSWEKYGPPEREAQGRGLMKKRAGRGADGRRMENTKCEGGRADGGRRWENRGVGGEQGGKERWQREGN